MIKLPKRVNFSRRASQKFVRRALAPIKARSRIYLKTIIVFIEKRPLISLVILLAILLLSIIAGNFFRKPPQDAEIRQASVIPVTTFNIGQAPQIQLQAQVEKSGVITIVAQTAGIVQNIKVKEGQTVYRGSNLLYLSANYQGANPASIQRQIAQNQYQNIKETYSTQKEIITKQKELAENNQTNTQELRSITEKSISDTENLISLNENIISTLDTNLETLENTNIGGVNDETILQTKQLRSQFLAATGQAKTGLEQAKYQSNEDNPPTKLAQISKDVAIKQLEIQQRALDLGQETARLQLALAQINESIMFPSSPSKGTIQRIYVKTGQFVSPGAPLITISSDSKSLRALVLAPKNIAQNISKLSPSYLIIEDKEVESVPDFISQEATDGQLYSIIFSIPADQANNLTDNSFIDVLLPIGNNFSSGTSPFVPLEAVHQTQDSAYVFVIDNGKAQSKKVSLGQIQGEMIEIASGLLSGDEVITTRNVVSGDSVSRQIL